MGFMETLNDYVGLLGCNNTELSAASGLSTPTISRYRKGERIPNINSDHILKLSSGIASLSRRASEAPDLDEDTVLGNLREAIGGPTGDYEGFLRNLNQIVTALGITNSELASATGFDPSYISRILSGRRHPADFQRFAVMISRFIAARFAGTSMSKTIAKTVGCDEALIRNENTCAFTLNSWLNAREPKKNSAIGHFLETIDSFDISEFEHITRTYAETSSEDLSSIPTFGMYTGYDRMKQADLDFFAVATSGEPSGSIFMYSDMPKFGFLDDEAFSQSMRKTMIRALGSGMTINVLHNTDRQVEDVLESLERWVPLYMTRKVFPYCFKDAHSTSVFKHSLKVANGVAVEGEAIAGACEDGRFILTQIPEDIAYLQKRADTMLKHARPLLTFFNDGQFAEAQEYILGTLSRQREWRMVFGSLPPFTLDDRLLASILDHNHVDPNDCKVVRDYIDSSKKLIAAMFADSKVVLEIPDHSKSEFDKAPLSLSLSGAFYEKPIYYTYDEYRAHVELTEEFATKRPSCTVKRNTSPTFRNIHLTMYLGKYVVISKSRNPAVHIMIDHPDLVPLFEQFVVPVSK